MVTPVPPHRLAGGGVPPFTSSGSVCEEEKKLSLGELHIAALRGALGAGMSPPLVSPGGGEHLLCHDIFCDIQ